MKNNNQRVLITGAAGFLGSHLCDRFLLEGYQVIGMDNFITGHKDNLDHLSDNENFQFIEHDVTEFVSLDGPLDHILHFASPASPIDYIKICCPSLAGSFNIIVTAEQ